MKKLLFSCFLFLVAYVAVAQETNQPTQQFTIQGQVKQAYTITLDSLARYTAHPIGDLNITNHTGDFKHKDEQLKGVLLKDILAHAVLTADSPKLFSEFYFTCTGADGYKVVYSWNELFNTPVGDHVYLLTEKNGVAAASMPERIQMTSTLDFKTGRRYLHNLDKIVVGRAQ